MYPGAPVQIVPLLESEVEALAFLQSAVAVVGIVDPKAALKQANVLLLKVICERAGVSSHNATINTDLQTHELLITPR